MLPSREDYLRELGANIRASRRKKKVTQASLANALSVSRVTIASAEKGKQNVPIYALEKMASALGMSVAELLPVRRTFTRPWMPTDVKDDAHLTWMTRIVEGRDEDE